MSTYSVNISTTTESTSYPDIDFILNQLPDNDNKEVKPKDMRDGIISTWNVSSFKETSVDDINYIGIDSGNPDDRDIKNKIFISKRNIGEIEIANESLLGSDSDLFIHNTKEDTEQQITTRLAILSGTNSSLYSDSPRIEIQKEIVQSGIPYTKYSWRGLSSSITDHLIGIHFINDNTGWVVGYENGSSAPSPGFIYKTTDGGSTWASQSTFISVDPPERFYRIQFLTTNTGYAVGDAYSVDSTVFKTTDGGSTWIDTGSVNGFPTGVKCRSIFFIDTLNGYVGGTGGIYKTTDGGSSWTHISVGSLGIYGLYFFNVNVGYAIDFTGGIYYTSNAGVLWTTQSSGVSVPLSSIYFSDINTGYVVGRGVILKTTNGSTWNPILSTSLDLSMAKILFPNNDATGYILGGTVSTNESVVLNTVDGGLSWNTQPSEFHRLIDGCFPSPQVGYGCGLNGSIVKLSEEILFGAGEQLSMDVISKGDISIKSLHGTSSINGIAYPTILDSTSSASNLKTLRYLNGSLYWDDIISSDTNTLGITESSTNILGTPVTINNKSMEYSNNNMTPVSFNGVLQGRTFNNTPIVDVLREIIYPYLPPICTLSIDQPAAEFGTYPNINLNYSVTKRTNDVTTITLNNMIPGNIPPIVSSGQITISGSASGIYISNVDTTFQINAFDGNTQSIATQSLKFVYPYFSGVIGTSSISTSGLSTLSKIISPGASPGFNINEQVSFIGNGYLYFIYYDSIPPLTEILDNNNDNVISLFTYTTETLVSPSWYWSAHQFKVYVSLSSYFITTPALNYKFISAI